MSLTRLRFTANNRYSVASLLTSAATHSSCRFDFFVLSFRPSEASGGISRNSYAEPFLRNTAAFNKRGISPLRPLPRTSVEMTYTEKSLMVSAACKASVCMVSVFCKEKSALNQENACKVCTLDCCAIIVRIRKLRGTLCRCVTLFGHIQLLRNLIIARTFEFCNTATIFLLIKFCIFTPNMACGRVLAGGNDVLP